jgi:asparagine N-glycosylation enzyme membrane subunit Stt3
LSKKYENIFYLVLFFFISILVFLSRQIQINYIKKFSNKFYIFNDTVLVNPDGYHHLSNIKNNLISHSNLLEKFFNENFLTSIYIFLFSIFDNPNLPELVMISSPYMVILAFFSIFIFFYSFSGKKIALLTSFTFTISAIFFARSSVLFFDTDTLNIFFTFFILFTLSLYFRSNLSRTNFYLISILFILSNYVFIFHYPKTIFSIIFIVLL